MTFLLWIGFIAIVLMLLAVDLGVFHRRSHVVSITEAAIWVTVWVTLALVFNAGIFFLYEHHVLGIGVDIGHDLSGEQAALQFFTGYVIEESLSLDNIFVIALILTYFGVPARYQHRVLYWGILGAIIMRGVMIGAGAALIERFAWMTYVFGGLLLVTAVKMLVTRSQHIDPGKSPLVRLARRFFPLTETFDGQKFFTRQAGRLMMTPMFLVLLVVESSDVVFAVDSIPAIFAVTRDPFLVFTSNVFAILGLRSLFFIVAGVMDRFRYLKISLVFVLAFVGVKMLLADFYHIGTLVSLGVIGGILSLGVIASLAVGHRDRAPHESPLADQLDEFAQHPWRQLRRMIVVLVGATALVIGLAMIVLPGPAVIVIPIGLALLGTEFLWARRLLSKMKNAALKPFGTAAPPPDSSNETMGQSEEPPLSSGHDDGNQRGTPELKVTGQ